MSYKDSKQDAETYKAPEGAVSAAKKALKWKEEYGEEVKGGTQVGWTRANQIAKGEQLSLETVKRMHSFFSRHKGNETVKPELKETPWKDNGYIAWLIWGGNAAAKWAAGIAKKDSDEKELRVDRATVLEKPRRTNNGYLEVDVCLGKIGVLEYWDNVEEKIRREYIGPEQLFNSDSYETLELVAATNEHPPEMLTPENTKKYQVGFVQKGIWVENNKLYGKMVVTDAKTIRDIESKRKVEVSPAYETMLVRAPEGAVHNGRTYDYIQTNRKYNHLAVVEAGRNGSQVAIKTDSNEFRTDSALVEIDNNLSGVSKMTTKIKVNGVDFEASETLASTLASKFDADEGKEKKLMDQIEKLKQDNEKLKAKCDQYKKDMEEHSKKEDEDDEEKKDGKKKDEEKSAEEKKDAFDAAVKARVALQSKASKFLPSENFDSLSNIEIMRKCVSAKNPELKMDSQTDIYIEARFDVMCEKLTNDTAGFDKQVANFDNNDTASSMPKSSLEVREAMKAKYMEGK